MITAPYRNWIDYRRSLVDAIGKPKEELCSCGTPRENPAHSPRCKKP